MGRGSNRRRGPGAALRAAAASRREAGAARESASRYRAGVAAWMAEDLPGARAAFGQALAADPTNADALLGLQYTDPADVQACENLYVMRSRLGAYQTGPGLRLHGRCYPLHFSALPVVDEVDTALAYAAALAGAGRV